ncbi:MAG: TRZ/ATZ family hydrolase [Methylococcus sp.]|nr:MAG: TRZ/ATZ family hydrolase [Methylococcus sp.]
MSLPDHILTARWVIPVEPHNTVLVDHAVVIREGRIIDLLPITDALARYQGVPIESFQDHVLIPGLINAHTHAAMSLLRGIADDLPLMAWLGQHIWPLEQRFVGEMFVRDGTDLAIAEMIRGGVTTFNDMYFFPNITAQRVVMSGVRATLGMILIDVPTAWARGPDEYFEKGLALRDEYLHDPWVQFAFAPHAPYSVSDAPLKRVATLAAELDLPVHMHVHETLDEINQSIQKFGARPLQRLHQLDLLGPHFMAVHMTQLLDQEIELIAESGATIVHCPESNLKLASGFCPIAKLDAQGINIALGTDGAASNNDLDMLGEMRTAALLAKGVAADASAVPASHALRMATLGGAKALGRDADLGSLEVGKWADIAAVRLDDIESQPLFHPLSALIYAAGRHQVSDVWVGGKRLLKDRALTTLDLQDLKSRISHWRQKLTVPATQDDRPIAH